MVIDGFDINDTEISILNRMCKLNVVDRIEDETIVRPITNGKISFRMSDIVNKEEELLKINKELDKLESEIKRSEGILSNKSFLEKAPEAKVDRKSTRLNSSHTDSSRMPSSA